MSNFNKSGTARVLDLVTTALAAACMDRHCGDFSDLPGNLPLITVVTDTTQETLLVQDAREFIDETQAHWFDDERDIND